MSFMSRPWAPHDYLQLSRNITEVVFNRVLGNGTVLMPLIQLQGMFGTPVNSAVLEPQIFMKQMKVVCFAHLCSTARLSDRHTLIIL